MPWSTWTTRSPTFRSRKSERNVRVADRRRSCVLRSSSKTSVSAQNCRPASGRRKPRESWPTPTSTDGGARILGALDRRRADLVVGEQLDRALGAARRVRRRTPPCRRARGARRISATQSGNAAGELQRRLTGDVHDRPLRATSVSSAVAPLEPRRDFVPGRARAPTARTRGCPCASRVVVDCAGSARVSFCRVRLERRPAPRR